MEAVAEGAPRYEAARGEVWSPANREWVPYCGVWDLVERAWEIAPAFSMQQAERKSRLLNEGKEPCR